MKIIIYANCQGNAIKQLLEKVFPNFQITLISNYDSIVNKRPININLINNHDVILYQPIKKK